MRTLLIGLSGTLVAGFLAGCSLVGNEEASRLEDNKRLWRKASVDSYQIEYFKGCYCLWVGRARIVVRDDTVHAVLDPASGDTLRHPQSGEPMFELYPELFPTVEELFEIVEKAIGTGADELEVEYDDRRGFPERIDIDYYRHAIDDEVTHAVSAFAAD